MSANPKNARPDLTDSELTDLQFASEPESESELSLSSSYPPPISYAPGHEALQALLAFSSLHAKIRERRARERIGMQTGVADVWELEQFVLDEVLQLVSERALTLTGADGVAIALVDGDAFVCRASAGSIAPEAGARLDPRSGFSGACLRTGGIVRCDDSENDVRVNVQVCRRLGTRSIVAVPITSSRGIIGLLEAFSSEAYGFNDSDVRSLKLLVELILAAVKPEEEDRMAEISRRLVAGETNTPATSVVPGSTLVDESKIGESEEDEPLFYRSAQLRSATFTSSNAASPIVERSNAELEAVSAIFQLSKESHNSSLRIGLTIGALAIAILAGGWWWKTHRQSPVSQTAPTPSSASQEVPEIGTPNQNAGVPSASQSSPSSIDTNHPMQQLVTGIWNVSSADSSTVIIDLQGEVQYEAHRLSDPERIYFDLHGTSLAHGLFGKTIEVGDPMLARVRIAQPRQGVSRIVLETNAASDFSVSLKSNPYRLVVEIRKRVKGDNSSISAMPENDSQNRGFPAQDLSNATATESALMPGVPGRAGGDSERPLPTHVSKFRLVLDAGHGGWDLGTVGRSGLMEKDLVLDIVTRLGKLVESRLGAEVIFTRDGDTYLPLEKRTEIANLAQADMFVSVHANYSEDSSARGAETYYTNTYSSVRARTANAEAPVPENINWNNVDIREKVQRSRRFAVAVQQAMYRALAAQIPGIRNRGVKKASYVVLTGTSMPAILAEVSFVSSPADEDKLKSSNYRQNIAEALYKGIAQFAATGHHENLASASSKTTGL
jgi:N-acetylmuramoyl-L-alanine amidase